MLIVCYNISMKNLETPTPVPAQPPVAPTQSSNGLPVASMVLGILSLTGFGPLLGVPAIILGIVGLKKSPHDRGLSWAGIITGAISTIVATLLTLALIALIVMGVIFGSTATEYVPYDEFPSQETVYLEHA